MRVSIVLLLVVFVGFMEGFCHAIVVSPNRSYRVLQSFLPKHMLKDFEYEPTEQGYRFSYQLYDGTRHEEIGYITDSVSDNQDVSASEASIETHRGSTRPKTDNKSRQLSPNTLQGLIG